VATVSDGELSASNSATVVVEAATQGIDELAAAVDGLGGAKGAGLNAGELNALQVKLANARADLGRGNAQSAANTVGAFVNQLQAMIDTGRVPSERGVSIVAYAQRVIRSIGAR
jgi:hypothetical protein